MNQIERHDQFDIDKIRKQISDATANTEVKSVAPAKPLNPYAARIASQFALDSKKPAIVAGLIRIGEAVLVAATCLGFYLAAPEAHVLSIPAVTFIAALAGIFATFLTQVLDGYLFPVLRSPRRGAPRVAGGLAAASFIFCLVVLYRGGSASALFSSAAIGFVVSAGLLSLERTFVAYAIRRWTRNGFMERRAVIVGGGAPARDLIREMESISDNDIRICGIFDDRDDRRSPDMVAGYPKLGTFDELVEFARTARIDILIIALPLSAELRILDLLRKLWVLPVDIRIAAHSSKLRFRPRAYSRIGKVSMLDVFDKPIADWDSVAKRVFDIVFSLLAITLLWPIMLGAALAVKFTSRGPIIFKQKRHGFNNEVVEIYKFRSMYTEMSDPTAKQAVTKNDPRVTPVGRFIRKTSIDELPQFFNVLQGRLSLVGPRPHAVAAQTQDRVYAEVVDTYFARHRVKPGVTGWAQINGWRGEIDTDEKIRGRIAADLYYIENWSLWLDLKILIMTPIRLLKTDNAY
ncbi:undecaprenyl-phosphate glucose phosphotransferase [Rhizobium sp. C4]|uniref:undecaprenyl-phosphate glucose phosphotransferase n=1 Tax=Rhizobium sp. C4 TaxID=1349800 RepID=UPI001E306D97|nr:undecaprenyl-phosphate glucose phosphotransferase [Rhizobium sp. C4]MCD2171630.1 undecaprenyl-phosphate glucose phosphotransferase [Rhizobium sp. C4]